MFVGCAISRPLPLSKSPCICLSFPLHKRSGLDLKQTFLGFASISTMLNLSSESLGYTGEKKKCILKATQKSLLNEFLLFNVFGMKSCGSRF